jgi:hypothetical protein
MLDEVEEATAQPGSAVRQLAVWLVRHPWYVVAVAVIACLYYVSAFSAVGFGSQTRFRIILAILFLQSIGLLILGALISNLLSDLRSQHTAATQIATIRGLWRALEAGAESDAGLPIEVRRKIYAAGREAFAAHDKILRREGLSPRTRDGRDVEPDEQSIVVARPG